MGAVLLAVLALPVLGLAYLGLARTADLYYKTGWMVAHWNEAAAFPASSNVCMHEFCTRTDTKLKHVGGRSGYTSEIQYYYCPLHESSFFATGGQFDGFLYFCYWLVAIACSAIPPFLLIAPFSFIPGIEKWFRDPYEWPRIIVAFVPLTILVTAWMMFAWW